MDRFVTNRLGAARRRQLFASRARPQVRILPASAWGQAEQRAVERLLAIDPVDILGPYLRAARLMPVTEPKGPPDADRGSDAAHTLLVGTYLSACALALAARASSELVERLASTVDLLDRCQEAHERHGADSGYLSSVAPDQLAAALALPQHSDHIWREMAALLVGLLDVTRYTSIDCSAIAARLGRWVAQMTSPDPSVSGGGSAQSWWSTVASALAQLSMATGERREVRGAAIRLHDPASPIRIDRTLTDPDELAGAIDDGIGAMSLFILGDDSGFEAAEAVWHELTRGHIGPDGGVRARCEDFDATPPERPADARCRVGGLTVRTVELAVILLACEPDSSYSDYLDLVGANYLSVTASSMPNEGVASEVPFGPAVRMDRLHEPGSVCELVSLLTLLRLRQSVFTLRGDEVSVNLYVSASLEVPGSGGIEISRLGASHYQFDIVGDVPGKLQIRWPDYASAMRLAVDEAPVAALADLDGYVVIPGERRPGDSIEVEFDWEFRVFRSEADPAKFAVRYGPWVMVALTDRPDWLRWPPRTIESALRETGPNGPWQLDSIPIAPLRVVGTGAFHSMFLDPEY